jgi:hypothetical protein
MLGEHYHSDASTTAPDSLGVHVAACWEKSQRMTLWNNDSRPQEWDEHRLLFEDLFVVGCEALFVVWVGKVVPNPVL